eukprot:11087_1
MSQKDTIKSFDDLYDSNHQYIPEDLLRGIYAYGFEKPSKIQQRATLPLIKKRDVIAQSQSGTGKTAVFSIGSLALVDTKTNAVQILIMAPTRELAQQIWKVISCLGAYINGLETKCVIGGTAVREDIYALSKGVHIVIGTAGRIKDMISRGALKLDKLKLFVLDEADEMLSRGFKSDIDNIYKSIAKNVQKAWLGATLTIPLLKLTNKYMHNPLKILIKKEELTLKGMKQYYVCVTKEENKLKTICDLYEELSITQALIYCNTRRKVDWLKDKMKVEDFTVGLIHGDLCQKERE